MMSNLIDVGVVYLTHDTRQRNRLVAPKILHSVLSTDPGVMRLFQNEAGALHRDVKSTNLLLDSERNRAFSQNPQGLNERKGTHDLSQLPHSQPRRQ